MSYSCMLIKKKTKKLNKNSTAVREDWRDSCDLISPPAQGGPGSCGPVDRTD